MKVSEAVQTWGLAENLSQNLLSSGIETFFPVQNDVIPILLAQNSQHCIEPQDICVSAPTGSGKTLSYAVPIVDTLLKDPVPRLRALILLPSRELANQVNEVFTKLVRGTHLRVAVATGQNDFEQEQKAMMGTFAPLKSINNIVGELDQYYSNKHLYRFDDGSLQGISNVDVLICTSGRLLDHLQLTKGFTLQHLRFLVLDEADRLLGNAYHGWVRSLVQSASATTQSLAKVSEDSRPEKRQRTHAFDDEDILHSYLELRQPLQRLLFSATLTDNPSKLAMLGIYSPLLIHSASYGPPNSTTTKTISTSTNPTGDEADGIIEDDIEGDENAVEGGGITDGTAKFTLPTGLSESRIIVESENRPMTLICLILEALGGDVEVTQTNEHTDTNDEKKVKTNSKHPHRGLCSETGSMCIVFTSSVEETHRLCKLLQLVNGQLDMNGRYVKTGSTSLKLRGRVEEMSRTVRADERTRIMQACQSGEVSVLVSSDHLARGIDLPNIRLVINYDPPKHVKTYVHRAGRTARAQRTGHCVSILNIGQVGMFRKLRGQVDETELTQEQFNTLIKKCSIRKSTEESINDIYKRSIKRLPNVL